MVWVLDTAHYGYVSIAYNAQQQILITAPRYKGDIKLWDTRDWNETKPVSLTPMQGPQDTYCMCLSTKTCYCHNLCDSLIYIPETKAIIIGSFLHGIKIYESIGNIVKDLVSKK